MSRAHPRFHRNNPMPPFVPDGLLFRFQVRARLLGQMCISTMYYLNAGPDHPATPEADLVEAWRDRLETNWLTGLSDQYEILGYKVSDPRDNTREPVYVDLATSAPGTVTFVSGTASTYPLPPQDAVVITKRTSFKGQHGRGRLFYPGTVAADSEDGKIKSARKTAIHDNVAVRLVDTLTTGALNSDWQPYLYRTPTLSDALHRGVPLTGIVVRDEIGTVRRRRIGKGA